MTRDLLPSIIIAVACSLVFVLLLPKWDEVSATRVAQTALTQLNQERQTERDNLAQLVSRTKASQADISKLNLLLPEKEQLDQIIVNLQTAAQQNGFQLKELTMGNNQAVSSGPQKIAVKITGSGSYASFFNYLQAMEQSLRLYDVNEISIGHDNNSPSNFSVEFKLDTYNLK